MLPSHSESNSLDMPRAVNTAIIGPILDPSLLCIGVNHVQSSRLCHVQGLEAMKTRMR
jgi:hypothetical protein